MKQDCPYCQKTNLSLVTEQIRDSEDFAVRKCQNCGLMFLDEKEQQLEKDLKQYYNEQYGLDHSLVAGEKISPEEHFEVRLKSQEQALPDLEKAIKPADDVLEIGCACGSLLHLIKDKVKSVTGLEINQEQAVFASQKLGCQVYNQPIEQVDTGKKFDLIIMISVLEHMEDPFTALQTVKKLLKPGGRLFLELPNCNEALLDCLPEEQSKKYQKFFYHKAHLFYFTEEFFTRLLKELGFKATVSSRHDYSLMNFLHWWFRGERQKAMGEAQLELGLYDNEQEPMKKEINEVIRQADGQFKKILQKHKRGYILTYTAKLI